jgi:hypothetical protein
MALVSDFILIDCEITFINAQFVKRYDKGESFQERTKANDNAFWAHFNITAINIVVQNEQIPNFNACFSDEQLGRSYTTHGPALF